MKKLLKSKKALSPVVAAIILIAVTVAVSIAVAAWMGSMTFTFMETEQITITKLAFAGTNNTQITATVMNTGTTDVIISSASISGYNITTSTFTITGDSVTIAKGATDPVIVTFTASANDGWVSGSAYKVELLSSKGNKFAYTDTA
ncbi:MAG: hypothetical protein IBV52_05475 [Candidatus Bathyarchaeota archaeon]